jgi:DNA polymerase III sliding clamp (beta) subunit (PCNA family)
MLAELKFVQGGIAKKDFEEALTHFKISNGIIKSYNGRVALSTPIALNLDITPKAVPFMKAIAACNDTVQLHMTPAGRLSIKSGPFKVFVECLDNAAFPDVEPEGDIIPVSGDFMKAIRAIAPFIADDASREWARGILFRGTSAYATNNIIIVQYWLGHTFPVEVNVPKTAIAELIRINEEPTHLQVTATSITFHFTGNRWLRTQTFNNVWPDVNKVLDRPSNQVKFPEDFFAGLAILKPFMDKLERVFFEDGKMSTHANDVEEGAVMMATGLPATGIFNLVQLTSLEGLIDSIDLTQYPAPCLFYGGDRIRGAMVGIRPT